MIKDEAVEQDLRFTAGNVEVKIEDMAAGVVAADGGGAGVANPTGFDPMDEDDHQAVVMATIGEKDLWLDRDQEHLLDVNDASIFYSDFPPLPDFPCMSSSSSSSSTPAASKPMAPTSSSSSAASSSPAASWAVMKSDAEEDTGRMSFQQTTDVEEVKAEHAALSSTASMEIPPPSDHDGLGDVDCIDVMENFGYMDLIDTNEIWDPSSVFQSENPQEFLEDQQTAAAAPPPALLLEGSPQDPKMQCQEDNDGFSFLQGNSELAMIFFEWLKQNKDYISAEDMRSIKLKRSTIESASKRLGSTKEGKKQLLKLILEWVEQYQLQKKRMRESGPQSPYAYQETVQNSDPNPNPNPNPNFSYSSLPPDPNTCFSTSPWMPPGPPPHASEVTAMVAAPPSFAPPMATGYGGGCDPYSNPIPVAPMTPMNHHQVVNGIPYQHSAEYPVMEHAQSWVIAPFPMQQPHHQFSPYPDNSNIITHQQALYGHPYQLFDPNGERLMRLGSSATKEARKKRMARQRRLYSHHHRHSSNSNQHQNQMNDAHVVGDAGEDGDQAGSPGNWVYWSPGGGGSSPTPGNGPPAEASQPHSGDRAPVQQQSYQRQSSSDRRQQQGWKTEKNLKFLLQKVLKQSDVGNLGRIVLPKKEAESHLPELESRDGISIAMEDIGTSRVWNMRYRFWPNNKSRMYLLENTGDFVRVNGLQEGDFIVIYSDTKCGKYMIRGVKVRQPGGKLEGKKPARRNMRNLSLAGNSSSLAPIKQAVR
ncbi:B3 domain-containing transcription factor ABI3 [Sesamum alatum]|uniref:B3 domain-containing transcription factor ABI3 n=1 Tax=Sesamum alatum TaxID=300844 RepID=A0AAE2CES7_9LAMI|nr:B3 domain-containing transcription factor ABI3 [Sesamum alatum]